MKTKKLFFKEQGDLYEKGTEVQYVSHRSSPKAPFIHKVRNEE